MKQTIKEHIYNTETTEGGIVAEIIKDSYAWTLPRDQKIFHERMEEYFKTDTASKVRAYQVVKEAETNLIEAMKQEDLHEAFYEVGKIGAARGTYPTMYPAYLFGKYEEHMETLQSLHEECLIDEVTTFPQEFLYAPENYGYYRINYFNGLYDGVKKICDITADGKIMEVIEMMKDGIESFEGRFDEY